MRELRKVIRRRANGSTDEPERISDNCAVMPLILVHRHHPKVENLVHFTAAGQFTIAGEAALRALFLRLRNETSQILRGCTVRAKGPLAVSSLTCVAHRA